jgi:hypothetical protein
MIGVAIEHLVPGPHVGSLAEPQAGAEEKEGERHEDGPARPDALACREQVSRDPGDEEPERGLLG